MPINVEFDCDRFDPSERESPRDIFDQNIF
jgi:hypothetical protein